MSGFRGTDDSGQVVEALTPQALRLMLDQCAEFVIVENADGGASQVGRALRERGSGAWRVEVSAGLAQRLCTRAPNTDAAYDILRSWAAGDGWWQESFSWRPG